MREAELAASAALFGATLVHWDLGDGTSGDPLGVLDNWAAKAGGEDAIVQAVQQVIGDAEHVVTFDPRHGDSCHADHRAAGALAIYAVSKLGQPVGMTLVASRQVTSPAVPDPAIASFDANRVLAATSAPAWSLLVQVLETHASQLTPDEVAEVQNVPPAFLRTYLLDLDDVVANDVVANDPHYAGVCP